MSLTRERSVALQHRLRSMGPEDFIKQYLTSGDMAPRLLGTAFGIDPNMIEDDDLHLRILSYAIMRAFRKRQKLPQLNTMDDAAQLLSKSKNVMVITGAGISTSLGIPDFRSKGTGFYDKLSQMGYSDPQEVFDIHNFDENPQTFYSLAGDILPSGARFSPTHGFLKLLQDKGKLQTNYTQNIDNLEEAAGIERVRLIQCHGSFATASCRKCKYQVKGTEIFDGIRAGQVAYCKRCIETLQKQQPAPLAKKRKPSKKLRQEWEDSDEDSESTYDIPQAGVMKPDITFFGEQLPENFFTRFTDSDSKTVDLVIVIGTSLKVAPVSDMPNYLPHKVPHIYISREPVTHINFDIQLIGDCDHVVFELCRRAGWRLEHEMIPEDFRVKVRPYGENLEEEGEGRVWRWRVKPIVKKGSVGDGVAVPGVVGSDTDTASVMSNSTLR
ncbi:SIR2-domain-containing protein [Teratosphaeria nubilosa]|uniref:SIR2-domain-containing protein n=1 Tax=Teratosphaeria nubilosa TaxID=161662 RepID=A0A6G1LFJ0_9PEZI|nr:SIR2-domain-containing protein [Teratosphaeria nubilosa]